MRRFVTVLVVAFGLVGLLGAPTAGQIAPADPPYPPVPGADCAAVGIHTSPTWQVGNFNSVHLQVQNLGDTTALCAVFLHVRPGAQISPRSLRTIALGPGDSAVVSYQVRPSQAGTHTVTGCAWSIRPFDANFGNSCVSTQTTAVGGASPAPRFPWFSFFQ